MLTLRKIWPDLAGNLLGEFGNRRINKISCNSRDVSEGDLFVAIKGTNYDGHKFINEAIERGASVVVLEQDQEVYRGKDRVVFIKVPDSRTTLAKLAANFYGNPAQRIKTIGITGTNGKTTVSYLLEKILNSAGYNCGLIGTINYKIGDRIIPARNTTPGPLELQSYLAQMVKEKIDFCIMEVSSHSLDQKRIAGVEFQGAIFTNLTSDHLDYHLNRENYFAAKAKLFKDLKSASFACVNLDDAYGKMILDLTPARPVTYAIEKSADFTAHNIVTDLKGTDFLLRTPHTEEKMHTKLIGSYNVYNILAAASLATNLGVGLKTIAKGVLILDLVPGRLENIDCGQPFKVLVDFAHTEDALKNVLLTLRKLSSKRLLLVFGCGGDRDKSKREKMGRIADSLSDFTIVTTDNPRTEDPRRIAEEISKGFNSDRFRMVLDRREAIREAISRARKDDIVVIAGKGHEAYQIFKDRVVPWDDRFEVRKILQDLNNKVTPVDGILSPPK